MGHSHSQSSRRRLVIALAIIVTVLVAEIVGAVLSGSLALLADAGHMFSDAIGLTVALVATLIAARPATDRATFGYQRAEVFGAALNGIILLVVALGVGYQAIVRLINPDKVEIHSVPMLVVAGIGLLANIAALIVLRPGRGDSINMRGAYLEVLGDLLGSVAVIISALIIIFTGWLPADAVASLAIALMIAPRAMWLLRDAFVVLAQVAPDEVSVAEVRSHIMRTDGVIAVHDVHVWAMTTGQRVFSAHVVVEPEVFTEHKTAAMLDELSSCLEEHFDVAHSTFQLEPAEHVHGDREVHR